jgi:hypothetical protein
MCGQEIQLSKIKVLWRILVNTTTYLVLQFYKIMQREGRKLHNEELNDM